MCRLALLSLLLLALPVLAADPPKPVVTVNVRGDHVEYDQEAGTLVVHGQVSITARSDQPGAPTVSIASGELEADLNRGLLVAHDEVRLLSQQIAMRGQEVEVDFAKAEFSLKQGTACVSALNPLYPDLPVRGYLFAQEMHRRANVIYMIEGRLTTCDRPNPHYWIGVSRFSVDPAKRSFSVRKGRIHLYGYTLTLPGAYASKGRTSERDDTVHQLLPGFSSYDGLYLPVRIDLAPRSTDWDLTLATRVGTRWRFPGEIRAERDSDREQFAVLASRREEVTWDLSQGSRLNRVPELNWLRHLTDSAESNTQFDLGIEAARIEEKPINDSERSATRARLTLAYSPRARARSRHHGLWWGLEGVQSFYDSGEALTDLQAEIGWGGSFGSHLRGATWFVHHETSGTTPFRFDDIYADNEIFSELQADLGHDWFTRAASRFDTEGMHLRNLEAGLYRRVHCLTWGVTFDRARERWNLAVDLSGLTGGTPPYRSKPLVADEEVPPLPPMAPGKSDGSFQFTLPTGQE